MFELVVDIGSSIGLWVGLSVLGMFDGCVAVLQNVQRRVVDTLAGSDKGERVKRVQFGIKEIS